MYLNGLVPYKSALAAAVILLRYGGLNYARGINEVLKQKKMSHCIMMYNARAKILNDSASFTTKCIMATNSHRKC